MTSKDMRVKIIEILDLHTGVHFENSLNATQTANKLIGLFKDNIQEVRLKYMEGLMVGGSIRRRDCYPCKYLDFWDDMYYLMQEMKGKFPIDVIQQVGDKMHIPHNINEIELGGENNEEKSKKDNEKSKD